MTTPRVSADDMARYVEQRNRAAPADAGPPPQMVVERFVAYVSDREADAGSRQLRALIGPVREDFRVVDVSTLQGELPDWLDGTPTLVDVRGVERVAHKGSAALELVRKTYPAVCK